MIYALGLLIGACVAIVVFLWRLPSSVAPLPTQQIPSKKEIDVRFKRLEDRTASLEIEFKRTYKSLLDTIHLEKEGKIDSADILLQQERLKELEKDLDKLKRNNSRLKKGKAKQKKTITELRQKEEDLIEQLAAFQRNLQEIKGELIITKDKLFKQEVVSGDNETELLRIKKENERLRNELRYEKSF